MAHLLDFPFDAGRVAHGQHHHAGLIEPALYAGLPVAFADEVAIGALRVHAEARPAVGFGDGDERADGVEGEQKVFGLGGDGGGGFAGADDVVGEGFVFAEGAQVDDGRAGVARKDIGDAGHEEVFGHDQQGDSENQQHDSDQRADKKAGVLIECRKSDRHRDEAEHAAGEVACHARRAPAAAAHRAVCGGQWWRFHARSPSGFGV